MFGNWIRIRVKSWIQICIKVKIQKLYRLKTETWRVGDADNGGRELKMEPWRFLRPVVADSHPL
jgi:hypothetical protein